MTEKEEAYVLGQKALWLRILHDAARNLELSDNPFSVERTDVIQMLRHVCADHGDNDWPDNLHLSDILEKHLFRYLGL